MKTKEELNALKEELEALNKKLNELTDEELAQVSGGLGLGPGVDDGQAFTPKIVIVPRRAETASGE